jgi:hypothetical protein
MTTVVFPAPRLVLLRPLFLFIFQMTLWAFVACLFHGSILRQNHLFDLLLYALPNFGEVSFYFFISCRNTTESLSFRTLSLELRKNFSPRGYSSITKIPANAGIFLF